LTPAERQRLQRQRRKRWGLCAYGGCHELAERLCAVHVALTREQDRARRQREREARAKEGTLVSVEP
jgi:hypothetical protein